MSNRVGGVIFIKADGVQYRAKGSWTYNLGKLKKEGIVGADGMHGYKAMPQVPFIEGAITDDSEISVEKLLELDGATVTLELANGKVISLSNAWFAGEGNVSTEEGEIEARFEGMECDEIR
jgi:hypothetical protein